MVDYIHPVVGLIISIVLWVILLVMILVERRKRQALTNSVAPLIREKMIRMARGSNKKPQPIFDVDAYLDPKEED